MRRLASILMAVIITASIFTTASSFGYINYVAFAHTLSAHETEALDTSEAMGLAPDSIINATFANATGIFSHHDGYTILSTPVLLDGVTLFPSEGSTYAVLSTGNASAALDPNDSGSSTLFLDLDCDPDGFTNCHPTLDTSQDFDLTQLTMNLTIPADKNAISFDSRFYSEEWPEFVGSEFNDAFLVEMGDSTFTLFDNGTILAPDNVVFVETEGEQRLVTVNAAGPFKMNGTDPDHDCEFLIAEPPFVVTCTYDPSFTAGTTYDGATPRLSTIAPIPQDKIIIGEGGSRQVKVIFSIFDMGDDALDSAVFIDNFLFTNASGGPSTKLATDLECTIPPTATSGDSVAVSTHLEDATTSDPVVGATIQWSSSPTGISGSSITNASGFATTTLDLTGITPGNYNITATFPGDDVHQTTICEGVLNVQAAPNMVPDADAGPDQTVNEGSQVQLNGSSSTDPDDGPQPLTFLWEQIVGPLVTISGNTTETPSFTAPEVGSGNETLTFKLTVSDGASNSTDTVDVLVVNVPNPPQQASLTVIKRIINDDGGNATLTDFILKIDGNAVTNGTAVEVQAGVPHTVSENATSDSATSVFSTDFENGVPAEFSGVTTTVPVEGFSGVGFNGSMLINPSLPPQNTTLTLTNLPTHTTIDINFLLAIIDSWDGTDGVPAPDILVVKVDGVTVFSETFAIASGSGTYDPSKPSSLGPQAHHGFNPSWEDEAYNMTLESAFHDIPHTSDTVTIVWTADGAGWQGDGDESWGIDDVEVLVNGETGQNGKYTTTFGESCPDGVITVQAGQSLICEITNNDIASTPEPALLTVIKRIVNDDGGNATLSDFTLKIDNTPVANGTAMQVEAGVPHHVSENASATQEGKYSISFSDSCPAPETGAGQAGIITVEAGQSLVCTITNDDIPAPPPAPTVTIIKHIEGGSATLANFTLMLNGNAVTNGTTTEVIAGQQQNITEAFSPESLSSQYEASFAGDCDSLGIIDAAKVIAGATLECTITNTLVLPAPSHLTVIKHIVNDNGGTASLNAFILEVNGTAVVNGTSNLLDAGSYIVSESAGGPSAIFSGYAASFSGDCNESGIVTLAAGDDKTCIITNDDIQPTLTVIKQIINDDGGAATLANFTLQVNGTTVANGTSTGLNVGLYVVSEISDVSGYTATFSEDCSPEGLVSLGLAQDKTCIITNNDNAPPPPEPAFLTVIKRIVNDDGGNLVLSQVELAIDGSPVTNGTAMQVTAGVPHSVSESLPVELADAYTTTFSDNCPDGVITVQAGQSLICEITNNDIASPPPENTPGKITLGGAQIGKDVNFGGNAQSDGQTMKGQFEYQDKTADINLHSIDITALAVSPDGIHGTFSGTATVNGEAGYSFTVTVEDNGEPGKNDRFTIVIAELDYELSGSLAKGNIQVHK